MQKKTMVELGVIGVLLVALVLASASLIGRTRDRRGIVPPKARILAKVSEVSGGARLGIKIRRIKDDNFFVRLGRVADALPLERDPFSFSGEGPRSSRDNLDFTGIIQEGESPVVIIEGNFYKVGDSNDQFSVVKILNDKVVLKDNEGEFELRLKS